MKESCRARGPTGGACRYDAAPLPETLQGDPAASGWLRQAWTGLCDRDPVDAVNDAELLHMWSIDRLARITLGVKERS